MPDAGKNTYCYYYYIGPPIKVANWTFNKVCIDELIIKVVLAIYSHCMSAIIVNDTISQASYVKVRVTQCYALSPLLFIIVMEALSGGSSIKLPWELLYPDDFALTVESLIDPRRPCALW